MPAPTTVPLTPGEIRDRAAALRAGLQVMVEPPIDPAAPKTDPNHSTGAAGLFGKILSLIPAGMEMLKALSAPGADKAKVLSEAAIPLLSPILRKIDIPWMPQAVEGRVWDFVEQRILPHLITALCTALHARGVG